MYLEFFKEHSDNFFSQIIQDYNTAKISYNSEKNLGDLSRFFDFSEEKEKKKKKKKKKKKEQAWKFCKE